MPNTGIAISFLIPVYNQPQELKKCISRIIEYRGNDIEVVINDNASEMDISSVVLGLDDDRIKLYRNEHNIGLDGNTIVGIERCRGEFVFLLRTADYVVAEAIPKMIEIIRKYKNVVYISGSCIDQDGLPSYIWTEGLYERGEGAFFVYDKQILHPSGKAFRRELVDLNLIRKYWRLFPEPELWFMTDHLIELDFTKKGDFYIFADPIWEYTQSLEKRKKSVIDTNGRNPSAPELTHQRYYSELLLIKEIFDEEERIDRCLKAFERWLEISTWVYVASCEDKNMQEHYGFNSECVDVDEQRNKFVEFDMAIEENYKKDKAILQKKMEIVTSNLMWGKERRELVQRKNNTMRLAMQVDKFLDEIRLRGISVSDYFKMKGFETIGLYGTGGYLGKKIWNSFRKEHNIYFKYICDRQYLVKMQIRDGVKAIPPKDLCNHETDIWIIAPFQYMDEIKKSIPNNIKLISVVDLLQSIIDEIT